jgi:2-keto-3-deoxy-L-fuconate dehydrogenase
MAPPLPESGICVLVTGAASGIGAAIARRFVQTGARVAGLDRQTHGMTDLGIDHVAFCDVTSDSSVRGAVDAAADALGGIDVVVCSAGVAPRGTVDDTDPADWDRVFGVNVRGLFLTARATLPHLRRSSHAAIINIASQLGLVAVARSVAYCASKGAVVQLTRAMALDHAAEDITVNAICPGPTNTPITDRYFADDGEKQRYSAAMPIGRMLEPDEIAAAALYLASPGARGVTGATLVVDGGYVVA